MAKQKSARDELVEEIRALAQSQGLNTVFTNFLEITATSIAAQMDLENAAERDKSGDKEGPVTINEPACGSGTMIIGTVWAMKRKNFDFQRKSFFVAQDIDIRCVWMAYIQLSLYGIPAVVIHGNTLSMEEWSRWYTPYAAVPFMANQSNCE